MTVDALRMPATTPAALAAWARARVAWLGLGAIVTISFVVRGVASLGHVVPQYFPDEYIYSSLARSIADHGALEIRGTAVHFPAILEPLLAAPFWLTHDPQLAYRLTLWLHSLTMSLAAVPVFLIVRRLRGGTGWALAAAALAVAAPTLTFSSYVTADAVAYPLVLGAIAAMVAALEHPTKRLQLLVLALSGLATFARVQYVVLPVVFVLAAFAVERWSIRLTVSRFRVTLALCSLPLLAAVALGPTRVLGYYQNVTNLNVSPTHLAHWFAVDILLLTLATGVVLVPGAIVGVGAAVWRPRDRAEAGFASATIALSAFLLLEAALYASNGSGRFQERYLIALGPLAAPAFMLAARRGRSLRFPIALLALGLLVYAVRVPISGYTYGSGAQDSPFLRAIYWLEMETGSFGSGSLVVATSAALLAVAAAVLAFRPRLAGPVALSLTALALVGTSTAAVVDDHAQSARTRATYLAPGVSWIDDAHLGSVSFLAPEGTQRGLMAEYLFSNSSLKDVLLLPGAPPPDVFAVRWTSIADDGTIRTGGKVVRTPLVIGENYAVAELTGATRVRTTLLSTLWRPTGTPRMSMLATGRYYDGWFASNSSVEVWPDRTGWVRGTLRLAFTVGHRTGNVRVRLTAPGIRRVLELHPGTNPISIPVATRGPWTARLHALRLLFLPDGRNVAAIGAKPVFVRDSALKPAAVPADRTAR